MNLIFVNHFLVIFATTCLHHITNWILQFNLNYVDRFLDVFGNQAHFLSFEAVSENVIVNDHSLVGIFHSGTGSYQLQNLKKIDNELRQLDTSKTKVTK